MNRISESGSLQAGCRSKKNKQNDLQTALNNGYIEVSQLLQGTSYSMEDNAQKPIDKLTALIGIIKQIVTEKECKDCLNYQSSLQRLQNQIRKHIRLEQQLRIFQDSIEEKIQEGKKEKIQMQKKIESQQHIIEQLKSNNNLLERTNKYEKPQALKGRQSEITTRRKLQGVESKENKIESDLKNNQSNHFKFQRRSIQKRGDSIQKQRAPSNTRSIRTIPLANQKIITQRNKEDRKRLLQSKLDYRR